MPDESPVEPSSRGADLSPLKNLRFDLPAGLVVFLVALPLCLGIAKASDAPIIAGLLAGIVGGLVVAPTSKSALSVSGPAAGLFTIVAAAIADLGSYDAFLVAVCIAGVIQIILGFLKAGVIAYYVPSCVVRGMLAGIGLVLILKQIPHGLGHDADAEGDEAFLQLDGENTFSEILVAASNVEWTALVLTIVGLAILIVWSKSEKLSSMRYLPAPLVVVLLGTLGNLALEQFAPGLALHDALLVGNIPETLNLAGDPVGMRALAAAAENVSAEPPVIMLPDFRAVTNPAVWKVGGVLAIVASIETLLCVEAIDKLDPYKRQTPTSHELKAQGIGNLACGLLGAIPITGVIVRGSANVQSGGRTWIAAFFHAVLLVITVVAIPGLLNMIPLAALAAILLHIGYRLASVPLFKQMWSRGPSQFLPFVVTVLLIVFTDLLTGVLIGLAIGVFFVLRANASAPYYLHELATHDEGGRHHVHVELSENVSFLNKAGLGNLLHSFPENAIIEIDGANSRHIDHDALEVILEFMEAATHRGIEVRTNGLHRLFLEAGLTIPQGVDTARAEDANTR